MTDQSADLVTRIDVIPDLAGLNSLEMGLDRAIKKVNELGAAIRHVNNLRPRSPYAPTGGAGRGAAPSAATTAAVTAIAASGANLVSRMPVAKIVQQEAGKIQRAIAAGGGFGGMLPPPGGGGIGGMLPPPGGGLSRRGAFIPNFDINQSMFSGEPLNTRRKPIAEGVGRATGRGGMNLGMDTMIGGAGLTAGIVAAWNSVSGALDSITKQENQLARLPQTIGEASDAFLRLNKAASETKTDATAFINTYANIATATEKMGLSEQAATEATQGLTSALALGGGSEQAVTNALYQMGQAFSSNRFGGDEFRSFMEAIGTMAPQVAKAFGTDVKGLREMSEQGKLTADVVVAAFRKMAAANVDMLKKQGWTWGQVLTVMGNDWTAFLAKATQGGEWQRLTDTLAGVVIPAVRKVENYVAEFWSTLADESKVAILMGILATLGAAFTALAIPVLGATWPFLAFGAAVFLLYELFVELKAWMDGKGGTMFDELFGPLDKLKKEYEELFWLLQQIEKIINALGKAPGAIVQGQQGFINNLNRPASDLQLIPQAITDGAVNGVMHGPEAVSGVGNGIMSFIEGILGLGNTTQRAIDTATQATQAVTNNYGQNNIQIRVDNEQQATDIVNGINAGSQNIATATGNH